MNQDNKEQNNNISEDKYVDPRNIDAEVIGELRKDKIGRPLLVLEIFGLIVLVLIGLPIVHSMLDDENSALYKLIYGAQIVKPAQNNTSEFLDGSIEQSLSSTTVMKYDNIVLKNFILNKGKVICNIYSYNDVINLDQGAYYLEVYSNSNNLLAVIKLTGTYDYQEKNVTFTHPDLSFNDNYTYFGKIVKMNNDDYPKVELSTDESGIGGLKCSKNNRVLNYTFMNGYLIGIDENYHFLYNNVTPEEYLNALKSYQNKQKLLGNKATLEEVSDGFVYKANINLDQEGFTYPQEFTDYEYYDLDTEVKIISYAMKGKGFDCR